MNFHRDAIMHHNRQRPVTTFSKTAMSLFRRPKKVPKRVVRLTTADEDEEEEGEDAHETIIQVQKKKRKRSKAKSFTSAISAHVGEEEETDPAPSLKRKKKKRAMGYGGMMVSSSLDEEKETHGRVNDDDASDKAGKSSSYSKEMLKELQAQQDYQIRESTVEKGEKKVVNERGAEEDFIPLSGGGGGDQHHTTVLSGEQAFALEEDAMAIGQTDELPPQINDAYDKSLPVASDEASGNEQQDWEARVAERAGISDVDSRDNANRRQNNNIPTRKSIGGIRKDILSTLQVMEDRSADAAQTKRRRGAELEQAQAEVKRYENDVQTAGVAVEYYQELRSQLADWVGAMRSLSNKLEPLSKVLWAIEADWVGQTQWEALENAVITVLHQHGMLERVEGRQPPTIANGILEELPTVDEFGRDVKSQAVRARENVFRERQKAITDSGEQSSIRSMHSSDQLERFKERRLASKEAIAVALDELDTRFRSLEELVNVFAEWQKKYPRDYQQTFASLSLGDLASVLVLVDVCGERNHAWHSVLQDALQRGILCPTGVERIVKNSISPYVTGLLSNSAYAVDEEADQVLELVKLGLSLQSANAPTEINAANSLSTLRKRISDYLLEALNLMVLPILKNDAKLEDSPNSEIQLSHAFAARTTAERASNKLCQTIKKWGSLLGNDNDWVVSLLNYCGGPFLSLALSIPDEPERRNTIQRVYQQLDQHGWIEQYIVESMPIRAAYAAFDQ